MLQSSISGKAFHLKSTGALFVALVLPGGTGIVLRQPYMVAPGSRTYIQSQILVLFIVDPI